MKKEKGLSIGYTKLSRNPYTDVQPNYACGGECCQRIRLFGEIQLDARTTEPKKGNQLMFVPEVYLLGIVEFGAGRGEWIV